MCSQACWTRGMRAQTIKHGKQHEIWSKNAKNRLKLKEKSWNFDTRKFLKRRKSAEEDISHPCWSQVDKIFVFSIFPLIFSFFSNLLPHFSPLPTHKGPDYASTSIPYPAHINILSSEFQCFLFVFDIVIVASNFP